MNRSLAILLNCYCAYLIGGCGSSQPLPFVPLSELDAFSNTIANNAGKDAVANDIAQQAGLKPEDINFRALNNKQQLLCAAIAHYTNPAKNTAPTDNYPLIILKRAMNLEGYAVLNTMPPTLQKHLRAYVATKLPSSPPSKKNDDEKENG